MGWREWLGATAIALVSGLLAASCGGAEPKQGADQPTSTTPPTTLSTVLRTTTIVPPTTVPPPEGVEEFAVVPSHVLSGVTVDYPQTPPVGGPHSTTWQTCAFYDMPVPSEKAVHSLEHGAFWITYRPDVPEDELQYLRELARTPFKVLVSRWDEGLPSPVVITSWGRQLKLESARDPRLPQFMKAFAGQAPEPIARC